VHRLPNEIFHLNQRKKGQYLFIQKRETDATGSFDELVSGQPVVIVPIEKLEYLDEILFRRELGGLVLFHLEQQLGLEPAYWLYCSINSEDI
jgi:hypothetical protein